MTFETVGTVLTRLADQLIFETTFLHLLGIKHKKKHAQQRMVDARVKKTAMASPGRSTAIFVKARPTELTSPVIANKIMYLSLCGELLAALTNPSERKKSKITREETNEKNAKGDWFKTRPRF